MSIEYKVVPAPEKARKHRGLKGAALFAHSIETLMNELAADGWQYVRADVLPQEERSGLTAKTTTYRNLLVFMREVAEDTVEPTPIATPEPAPEPSVEEPEDDDVVNLWQSSDTEEDAAPSGPSLTNR